MNSQPEPGDCRFNLFYRPKQPYECRVHHVQDCFNCPDDECCDNQNDSLKQEKELDIPPTIVLGED